MHSHLHKSKVIRLRMFSCAFKEKENQTQNASFNILE